MGNLVAKIPAEGWLAAARLALITEGIEAVKIDRLARQLGVSRGGFYYHFVDREDLLGRLIDLWKSTVVFVADRPAPKTPREGLIAIESLVERLLREEGYDPSFDLAVRAWAKSYPPAEKAVRHADDHRVAVLTIIFAALGCGPDEAAIRARVFYYHQIGYYFIDLHEDPDERRDRIKTYLEILCGENHLAAARARAVPRAA